MNVLVLSDFPIDPALRTAGPAGCVKNLYVTTGRLTGKMRQLRHGIYWGLAVTALGLCRKYDVLIFCQQFIGIYFTLLARLFGVKKDCVIGPLIYKPGGAWKKTVFQLAAGYPRARFAVFSSTERALYQQSFKLPADRIEVALFGKPPSRFIEQQRGIIPAGDFIFSGGSSNRDFGLLFKAAAQNPACRFQLACAPRDIRNLVVPANVQVTHSAFGERFEELMLRARLVVIPLKPDPVSAGQIVLLQALQAGRPIVIADLAPVREYVDDRLVYFYTAGDAASLQRAILRAGQDPAEAESKAARGREVYWEKFRQSPFARIVRSYASA